MRIPEKLKFGDVFKYSAVQSLNGVIDCLREIKYSRSAAENPASGARRVDEPDFFCTKTIDDNGNDALAVNGGVMIVIGASWQHRLVFDMALINVSALNDNESYNVCAVAYRKSGGTVDYVARILILDTATFSWMFGDSFGYIEKFVHKIAYFSKKTVSEPDINGGENIQRCRINYVTIDNKHGNTLNASSPIGLYVKLNLPALNDDTPHGYYLKPADFDNATVDIGGLYVYSVNSSGTFDSYSVANTNMAHGVFRGSGELCIKNSGTASSPQFELVRTSGVMAAGYLPILIIGDPSGAAGFSIRSIANSPIFWQKAQS